MLIVGFDSSDNFAKKIARILKAKYIQVQTKEFPDKETYLRYNTSLKGQTVMIVNSLYFPNQKIIQTAFAAQTAKDLGAKKVILFSPYLPYIRQDKRFKKGECLSSKILPKLLIGVDYFITVDPHLHRYKSLNQIFKIKTKVLSSNNYIAKYIKRNFKSPIIIGPDKESSQWAKEIAKKINAEVLILKKQRISSHKVKIKEFDTSILKGKQAILIDDIISSGSTMLKTLSMLKKSKINNINIICVHGLFLEHSVKKFKRAGVKKIISTNTIPSKYSKIDISNLIKEVKNAS